MRLEQCCSLLYCDGEMSGSEILFVAVIMSGIFCFEMSLKQSSTFRQSCELTFLKGEIYDL